jgi:hypothetical protein
MKRLFIYVEGMTEEIFVERMLRHHLINFGIKVEAPLAAKKDLAPDGPRGGFTNWPAMEADLRDWFNMHPDTPNATARFTTFLDLYAMPAEVPGFLGRAMAITEGDVTTIELAIAKQFQDQRFFPYLQRHEFEALLLSDPASLARIFPDCASEIAAMQAAIAGMQPEEINHGRQTHPAARINAAIPNYYKLKASNAYWVASEIGLDTMRKACPRFDAWLTQWEAWGMNA